VKRNELLNGSKEFWIANSLGWLSIYLVNIFFQTNFFTENKQAYGYSFVICGLAFLMSFVLRWLILKFRIAERKFAVSVIISAVLMVVASFLLVLIYLPILDYLYTKHSMRTNVILGEWVDLAPIFFIWTLIYVSYIIFQEQQKLIGEKYRISLELKESELSNLRNQLSPHFLFNSINNIRALVLVDPDKARDGLMEMSDLLRYVLNYQKLDTVPLSEEMEVVNSYLELNKIHLGDNVVFAVNVDESLLNFLIPPMSIQLLLENAIKHGELRNKAKVTIAVVKKDNGVLIQVCNPGSLIEKSDQGIGLQNLQYRLENIFKDKVQFQIKEKDHLVTAEIYIHHD
jgi:sensor histidine kinase YesM